MSPAISYDDFKSFFEDLDFLSEFALITDLTSHLNNLNLKLRQQNHFSSIVSHIDWFRTKLKLIKFHLKRDNFYFYPSCQILFTEHGKDCDFKTHLHLIDILITQFEKRFSDFETLRKELILFENPLTIKIEKQNLEFQAELCDLQNDLSLKTRPEKGIEFFNILDTLNLNDPKLVNFGFRIFSMFGSIYLCKCSFLKLNYINIDKRSCLSDASLSSLMRTASSNITIDIPVGITCKFT